MAPRISQATIRAAIKRIKQIKQEKISLRAVAMWPAILPLDVWEAQAVPEQKVLLQNIRE